MSDIIPFDGNLPAYLKNRVLENINSDLMSTVSTGFPVVSIKGKIFSIVRGGERTTMMNPKDPDSPATSIDVVLLKGNKGVSKVYYAKGYQEGTEDQKPDCYSNEGVKPEDNAKNPQSKQCSTCPHNQWGSKIGDNGGKGKACQDSKRLAIAAAGLINDPYLLRVPPASIRALGEYAAALEKRGIYYHEAVTKISFEAEAATPKLTFRALGYLPEEALKEVKAVVNSEIVASILGTGVVAVDESVAALGKPVAVVEKPKAEPKPKAKAEPKVVEPEVSVDLNLDDLNFDD
jgi:hypothetical protein